MQLQRAGSHVANVFYYFILFYAHGFIFFCFDRWNGGLSLELGVVFQSVPPPGPK
jgi:hypothetical protein